jgi:hypothetical protein
LIEIDQRPSIPQALISPDKRLDESPVRSEKEVAAIVVRNVQLAGDL